MSLALARKYRPKTFADVAVQSHVSTTLKGAIARGRVAHGYLLCGPRGVGQDDARARARDGAQLRATRRSGARRRAVRRVRVSCQRIWSGSSSLDVVEIDAASNRGVDDARELRERAMYAPSGDDRYKVYIVDEAHMLTREAWNALLKILEEPPPRVVFVFATTEPQKIAQAAAPVLSRLQRFDFKRIGPAEIRAAARARAAAKKASRADPEALAMIARAADGSMRDALCSPIRCSSMGDGARRRRERVRDALGLVPEDEFIALLDLIAERRAGDVFAFVARLADAGIDFGQFLTGFADMLRAQLAVALGGVAAEVSERAREALESRRRRVRAGRSAAHAAVASRELEPRFRKSGQQQLLLETLLVRFALLDRTVSLEDDAARAGWRERWRRSVVSRRRWRRSASARRAAPPPAPSSRTADRVADTPASDWRAVIRDADRARASHALDAVERARRPRAGSARRRAAVAAARTARAPSRTSDGRAARPQSARRTMGRSRRAHARGGKSVAATALGHASPAAVNARGDVTIALDEAESDLRAGDRDGEGRRRRRAARVVSRRAARRRARARERRPRRRRGSPTRWCAPSESPRCASRIPCSTRRSTRSISISPTDATATPFACLGARRRVAFALFTVAHRWPIS